MANYGRGREWEIEMVNNYSFNLDNDISRNVNKTTKAISKMLKKLKSRLINL